MTDIAHPASPQLTAWLQSALEAILETHTAPSTSQLQAAGVTAAWTAWSLTATDPFGVSTTPAGAKRHLAADTDSAAPSQADGLGDEHLPVVDAQHSSACLKQAVPYAHVDADGSTCVQAPPTAAQTAAALALAVTHASVRKLQQAPGATEGSNQVELKAFLDPSSLLSLGQVGSGVLGVGQLLASGLEQQVVASNSGSNGHAAAGEP